MVCGQRVRVEHAKARSANPRGGPSHGGYRGGEYVDADGDRSPDEIARCSDDGHGNGRDDDRR